MSKAAWLRDAKSRKMRSNEKRDQRELAGLVFGPQAAVDGDKRIGES